MAARKFKPVMVIFLLVLGGSSIGWKSKRQATAEPRPATEQETSPPACSADSARVRHDDPPVRFDNGTLRIGADQVAVAEQAKKLWVNGAGFLTLLSTTDLRGIKLARPERLVVHWEKSLTIKEASIVIEGNTRAEQEGVHLQCGSLQLFLAEQTPLTKETKAPKPVAVRNCVADKNVHFENKRRDSADLLGRTRLRATAVAWDGEEGAMQAAGPGSIDCFRKGKDGSSSTRITFAARMNAYRENRIIWYSNVDVIRMPGTSPTVMPEKGGLPVGASHFQCNQLKVFGLRSETGELRQVWETSGNVRLETSEFRGTADRINYDEINLSTKAPRFSLWAGAGRPAEVQRIVPDPGPPGAAKGRKIVVNWDKLGQLSISSD